MAISHEQIWQAADTLAADGESPTLAAVRRAVGGGSYTTISEAMQIWRRRQQQAQAPAAEPVPEAVLKPVQTFVRNLWEIAREQAHALLEVERQALEQARTQLETESREAAQVADDLAEELEQAKAALATERQARAAAEKTAAEQLREAEKARAQLQELRAHIEQLREERDHARHSSQEAGKALAGLEASHAAEVQRRQHAESEFKALSLRLEQLQAAKQRFETLQMQAVEERDKSLARIEALAQTLEAEKDRHRETERRCARAEAEAAAAEKGRAQLAQQVGQLLALIEKRPARTPGK